MNASPLILAADLAARLGDENLLVVDCRFDLADPQRGARDYAEAHIAGAVYADLNRDLSDLSKPKLGRHPLPDAAAFSAVLGGWGWTPQTRVVAYDDAGGALAAARLWWMLRLVGAENITVLDGGWAAWKRAGLPVDASQPKRTATQVSLEFATKEIVYTDELRALRSVPSALVLDARGAQRFRGEVEPIDPVAGHIPGAHNRPFTENLQADGRFKPAAELRAELQAAIGAHAPGEVIHSCGSGVSACQNLLAFEVAGLAGSHVYAPSWSGWIADPDNPVERG
ncbi:MAG: sulfurtransferase [Rudaea sp.]|uniref:sulfurtransferase n=1 Tax=unclassified Rudaea TaxID=2627037 RepID=UPI0010F55EDA|nr:MULTISPECIES: sulfurtransferase [unclassified Rudaea]MBN8886724.1 sulfurtransferase [Rudaea sp.]MBR0345829.1 sulfurtransferase [Rudaea sp.]